MNSRRYVDLRVSTSGLRESARTSISSGVFACDPADDKTRIFFGN